MTYKFKCTSIGFKACLACPVHSLECLPAWAGVRRQGGDRFHHRDGYQGSSFDRAVCSGLEGRQYRRPLWAVERGTGKGPEGTLILWATMDWLPILGRRKLSVCNACGVYHGCMGRTERPNRQSYRLATSMNRARNAQYEQLAGLGEVLRVAKATLMVGKLRPCEVPEPHRFR
jgi:hypothetical protein